MQSDMIELPRQNAITVERLKKLGALNDTNSYLEVGTFKGETFLALDFDNMVGVDPSPRFDIDPEKHKKHKTYRVKSDEYFLKFSQKEYFDLIFLDGLHTFEQTFRDFCACMGMVKKSTIVVIDDTVPNDYFSSLPDQNIAYAMRKKHGIEGYAWHGDTFKTMLAIHDFFPNWDYRTIIDNGNPQTILFQAPRSTFQLKWNNLEKITRATYLELQSNFEMLKPSLEAEAFSWLERATKA